MRGFGLQLIMLRASRISKFDLGQFSPYAHSLRPSSTRIEHQQPGFRLGNGKKEYDKNG